VSTDQPLDEGRRYRNLPSNLPKLTASEVGYLSWSSIFKSTIEDVPTFTYAQKLAALIECTQELPNMTPLTLCDPNEAGFYKGKKYVESLFADKDKIVENVVLQLEKLDPITEVDLDQITQLRAAFLSAKTCAELTGKLHLFQHRIKEAAMERLPDRVHINLTDRKISERRFMNELDKELAQEVVRTRELMARKKSRPAKTTSTTTGKRPLEQGVAACNITDDTFKTPEVPAKKFAYNGICKFDGDRHHFKDCQTPLATRLQNVRKQQLCENCLGTKHTDKDCWSKRRCSNCREKHHSMLCPKPRKSSNAVPVRRIEHQVEEEDTEEANDKEQCGTPALRIMTDLCFKTAIYSDKESGQPLRCLIDEAAGKNFITVAAANRLGLVIYDGTPLKVYGFGTDEGVRTCQYADLCLQGNIPDSSRSMVFSVVQSIGNGNYPEVPKWVIELLSPEARDQYKDSQDVPVEAIIGVVESLTLLGNQSTLLNDPRGRFAVQESELGTIVYGGRMDPEETSLLSTYTINELVSEVEMSSVIPPDTYVENFVRDRVRKKGQRIEVDVPIINRVNVEDNTDKCYTIMKQNYNKWSKSDRLNIVETILDDWKKDGIVEPVENPENPHHTLSYHVVEKLNSSTTKHRLVFNGSLKDYFKHHLNQKVFKGSTSWNIVKSMTELRRQQHVLVGDLRQAFLMVEIAPEYRDLFQFLWPHQDEKIPYRFCRVPFGTSASPFLLYVAMRKIAELEKRNFPELEKFLEWFYVDDMVCSFDTVEQKERIRKDCEEMLRRNGFTIEWSDEDKVKVLGLEMNRTENQLKVIIEEQPVPTTIRELAGLIPRRFDPCGFTEPMDGEL